MDSQDKTVNIGGSVFEAQGNEPTPQIGDAGEVRIHRGDRTYTADEVHEIVVSETERVVSAVLAATHHLTTEPENFNVSFEMKQASKGQMYFDVSVKNIAPGKISEALEAYDTLHKALAERANGGAE